jgi:hypothetical protein
MFRINSGEKERDPARGSWRGYTVRSDVPLVGPLRLPFRESSCAGDNLSRPGRCFAQVSSIRSSTARNTPTHLLHEVHRQGERRQTAAD